MHATKVWKWQVEKEHIQESGNNEESSKDKREEIYNSVPMTILGHLIEW